MVNRPKIKKKKLLLISILSLVLVIGAIVSTYALTMANTVKVTSEVVNIRNGPGLAYDITTQSRKNDRLKVLDEENEWYKVSLPSGETGWVASWLVENETVSAASNSKGKIISTLANVRSKDDINSSVIDTLNKNREVTVISSQNGWTQVTYGKVTGWIKSDFIEVAGASTEDSATLQKLTIREENTNIRDAADVNGKLLETAQPGTTYDIIGSKDSWYEVKTAAGSKGYVANWVVSVNENTAAAKPTVSSLSEATIVLDPGHGGNDTGAIGVDGTYEKEIALKTAAAIKAQLETTGAKVIMTRSNDDYVTLGKRAAISNDNAADAFISVHYDSTEEANTASGTSTYYYNDNAKDFASRINAQLKVGMPLENHGEKYGDFQVLRENASPSILLELGYINNSFDEQTIDNDAYRQKVANAVTKGLTNYFAN